MKLLMLPGNEFKEVTDLPIGLSIILEHAQVGHYGSISEEKQKIQNAPVRPCL